MEFRKLSLTMVRDGLKQQTADQLLEKLKSQQVAVYVMIGGGMIGRFAAEQPADFYIDMRVSRLPYGRRPIYQAVTILKMMAEELGYTGKGDDMPRMPNLHGSGVW